MGARRRTFLASGSADDFVYRSRPGPRTPPWKPNILAIDVLNSEF